MRFRPCTVTVTQAPQTLSRKQGRTFFKEFETCMNIDHPCFVLDCSKVREMDRLAVHMLLCCLEEAIKHGGDVKLAAVTPSARETLELTRAARLFEIYETETDAVNSFFRPHYGRDASARGSRNSNQISVSAA
jgi:anti-anti-sigma regulatory factor